MRRSLKEISYIYNYMHKLILLSLLQTAHADVVEDDIVALISGHHDVALGIEETSCDGLFVRPSCEQWHILATYYNNISSIGCDHHLAMLIEREHSRVGGTVNIGEGIHQPFLSRGSYFEHTDESQFRYSKQIFIIVCYQPAEICSILDYNQLFDRFYVGHIKYSNGLTLSCIQPSL